MNLSKSRKLFIAGIGLLAIGTILTLSFPTILEFGVRHLQQLRMHSDAYDKWIELPIPLTIKFYMFEVTNPREVIDGAKPLLRERGPYTFWEYRKKEIINYSPDGTTVKYWETKSYYFDASRSSGSIDEKITIINAPMVAIGSFVTKLSKNQTVLGTMVFAVVNALFAIYRTNLFIEKSPREVIFDGYKVKELDALMTIAKPIEYLNILQIPRVLPDNTFGLFYKRNATPEAFYEVYTGTGDFSHKFAHYITYRDQRKLNFWNSDYCNMINGTDGVQFQPFLTKNDTIYVFAFDLCRSIYLKYVEESDVQGIATWRFSTPAELFQGPHKNRDNFCFCPYPETPTKCHIDGVLDISSCWKGAPIILSNPHYLFASETITGAVDGLNPDPDIHLSYLDIEPRVGAVLRAYRRLQVSVQLDRIPLLRQMRNLRKNGIVPLLWLEESAEIDDALRQEINMKLVYSSRLGQFSFPAMALTGVVLAFASLFVCLFGTKQSAKQTQMKSAA